MKTRQKKTADVDFLADGELDFFTEEGTFDDNWIISANDLFNVMELPTDDYETDFREAA
jgi:hypothetical protein